MSGFQCPNCQCQISLGDRRVKHIAAAAMWFSLGGLLAAVIASMGLPKVGPRPLDPKWMEQVRASHKESPAEANELIAKRQADEEKDWQEHMSVIERGVLDVGQTAKAIAIVLLCLGIPAAVLAISIRPEPMQVRPPPKGA